MKTVKYSKIHKAIMLKTGMTLIDVQKLDIDRQNAFIEKELTPFLNSEIHAEAEAADQLIDMIRYWNVGQTEETYA